MRFVESNEERRSAFMDLVREALTDQMEELFGACLDFTCCVAAPESERGGNA